MIKSMKGAATNQFITSGKSKFSGLDEILARQRLAELNAATSPADLGRLNSVELHKLKGPLRHFWSIDINWQWRIIFKFRDGHAHEVEIADTHETGWTAAMNLAVFDYPDGLVFPPVHPGTTLAAELAAREISANALALKLRVPANRLTDILRGRRAISPETALRLAQYFGNSAEFWMTLQSNYDLALARQELGAAIAREVEAA